jgi:alpha-ribazole phosphatase
MAKEILFIRHSSLLIPRGICYGVSDIDVSENFNFEIQNLKKQLKGFTPDLVVSSPLKRCTKLALSTFNIVHSINSGFKELNYGDWEGLKWIDIDAPCSNLFMYENSKHKPPNGESFNMLKVRVVEQLESLLKAPEDKLAIVCHGGVIRSILSYFLKIPLERTRAFHIHYTGFVRFIKTNEGWRLTELNSGESDLLHYH